jgi:hypothetical protein
LPGAGDYACVDHRRAIRRGAELAPALGAEHGLIAAAGSNQMEASHAERETADRRIQPTWAPLISLGGMDYFWGPVGALPSAGRILWQGRDIAGWAPHRVARVGIGYVPEDRRIFAELSVWENFEVGARAARRPGRADKLERVARARALDGLLEPVVSDGKVVRDDKGQPLVVRRYADDILLAMLKAHRPEKFNDWKLMSQAIYPRWVKWLTITFLAALSLSALGDLLLRITQIRH